MRIVTLMGVAAILAACGTSEQNTHQQDIIPTSAGDLEISVLGHGTLMFRIGEKVIHVDPWTRVADYEELPDADLILVTHEHGDHLDADAIEAIRKENTPVVLTETCAQMLEGGGTVMRNGDMRTVAGVSVEAVPAYNVVNQRSNGDPYHPKGVGNGYVLTFGDTRIYVAGDTENTPEMKNLAGIDVAFLPMNLPYTMNPEMVADAAKAFRPKILYPYHCGDTDVSRLIDLLEDETEIEVRVREMS